MKNEYDFKIANRVFKDGTHIMAILNATPDSFYCGSRLCGDAVSRAKKFLADGAEVLDIGGQSTRPGAVQVGVIEEMSRVLPVVTEIREKCADALISVDTFYPEVASACLAAGANMINDVSCLKYDGMADVIASGGASVCVMHDRRGSGVDDLFLDKSIGLKNAVSKLLAVGVASDKILLDGGIGFNKGKEEDFELLNGYKKLINEFEEYPFLLGVSRKSMFGGEVGERLPATLDATEFATKIGVLFVRVHDVAENKAVVDAVSRGLWTR